MVVRLPEAKKYLNRDGLEEYNSLLPHSSAEIQEYVDDWLDAHPEATTTVQDGSITTQKLADGSVTRNKLAADVAHLLGGMMVTGEVQGEILLADDAYSVAPLSMTVDGKSTQDGTPTPDAPVPIDSIEVLELPIIFAPRNLLDTTVFVENKYIGANGNIGGELFQHYTENYSSVMAGTYCLSMYRGNGGTFRLHGYDGSKRWVRQLSTEALNPGTGRYKKTVTIPDGIAYVRFSSGSTIYNVQLEIGEVATEYIPYTLPLQIANIPMRGHVLRSVPDGTCDTMSLSYLRESDRDGWAWYSAELTQKIDVANLGASTWTQYTYSGHLVFRTARLTTSRIGLCTGLAISTTNSPAALPDNALCLLTTGWSGNGHMMARADAYGSATEFTAAMDGVMAQYKLTTPITIQLAPVELPVLPAPNCTIWSDQATGLKMSYMRDTNIVVSNLEQAIADL